MKSLTFAAATALACLSGEMGEFSAAYGAADSGLSVAITRVNQNLILSWFGSNALSYQVESSPTFYGWTNSSPVLTGSGAPLFFTNPVTGQGNAFFRVKR